MSFQKILCWLGAHREQTIDTASAIEVTPAFLSYPKSEIKVLLMLKKCTYCGNEFAYRTQGTNTQTLDVDFFKHFKKNIPKGV